MCLKKYRLKHLIGLITCLLIAGMHSEIIAQPAVTGVPFIKNTLDVRLQSLGNSFVSFKGLSGMHQINPAGVGRKDDLGLYFTSRESVSDIRFYDFGASFKKEKLGWSISSRIVPYPRQNNTTEGGEQSGSHKPLEFYQNASVSFELSKKWSVGFGLNYIHSDLASGAEVSGEEIKAGRALSADIGTIYNTSFSVADSWLIQTGFGISITDFGNLVKYTDNAEGDPLPMKFRTGLGLEAVYSGDWNGFKVIGLSSAVSLSKLLVALEFEENGSVRKFGPFQTIIKGWGVYKEQNPNNGEFTEYSLTEQFIYHAGMELTFLESFSFRMGYQNGQELNDFESLSSWGIGIDLYYLAIDYVNSSHTSEDYKGQETLTGSEYLQLKGRIPLDGKSPKSLLRLLID